MRTISWSRLPRRAPTLAFAIMLALFFLPASPAMAAASSAQITGSTLEFTAAAATANRVTVVGSGTLFTISDRAGVTAGTGCVFVSATSVSCSGTVTAFDVQLGDLGDSIFVISTISATIDAGPDNDIVNSGSGADTVLGGDGNDVLDAGKGSDSVSGGAGVDSLNYGTRQTAVTVTLDGVAGDGESGENDNVMPDVENLFGGKGNDVLTGGTAANVLTGGAGADRLDGGDGDDTLNGGTSGDTMIGGAGIDAVSYSGRSKSVTVDLDSVADDGEAGENDNIDASVEGVTGGTAADTLTGGPGPNTLNGGGGADLLDGAGGADTLLGGSGFDTVTYASYGGVTATIGGSGPDGDAIGADVERLLGGPSTDTFTGNAKANTLEGAGGDDTLNGAGGTDTLLGGDGADSLAGGAGSDLVDYSALATPVVATIGGSGPGGDTIGLDVENLTGGPADDTLTGDDDRNLLVGGLGNDTLTGGAGSDTLSGGDGNDTLIGGGGSDALLGAAGGDEMTGGAGKDVVSYASRTAAVSVTLDGAANDGESGEGDNVGADVESVSGGKGSDTLIGNDFANQFNGGAGNDTINGGAGKDILFGDAGADNITGGPASDVLFGGADGDTLNTADGGTTDYAYCGSGVDTTNADGADILGGDCE